MSSGSTDKQPSRASVLRSLRSWGEPALVLLLVFLAVWGYFYRTSTIRTEGWTVQVFRGDVAHRGDVPVLVTDANGRPESGVEISWVTESGPNREVTNESGLAFASRFELQRMWIARVGVTIDERVVAVVAQRR